MSTIAQYDETLTTVTILSITGVELRPVTEEEARSVRVLEQALEEAQDACGTPAFYTLLRRFQCLLSLHRDLYGAAPAPAAQEVTP